MSFSNKIILITGASGGIGASMAIEFAKEGANVVIVGRNETKLEQVANECSQHGPTPLTIKADVTKDEASKEIVKRALEVYGKIDVLINNAGIIKRDSILKSDYLATFDEIMNTNIRAVVNLTNVVAPYLVESKGNIINISSVASVRVHNPGTSCYKVSKAALDHFTRCIALELSPHGVRVNAINPGPTWTDIFEAAGEPGGLEHLSKQTALGGACEPTEIADLALFLASDKARSITGSLYVVDRGILLK